MPPPTSPPPPPPSLPPSLRLRIKEMRLEKVQRNREEGRGHTPKEKATPLLSLPPSPPPSLRLRIREMRPEEVQRNGEERCGNTPKEEVAPGPEKLRHGRLPLLIHKVHLLCLGERGGGGWEGGRDGECMVYKERIIKEDSVGKQDALLTGPSIPPSILLPSLPPSHKYSPHRPRSGTGGAQTWSSQPSACTAPRSCVGPI